MAMMVYSKGGDTTNCHMRYWKLCLFWGMWRVRGLALMAKSMQALCGRWETHDAAGVVAETGIHSQPGPAHEMLVSGAMGGRGIESCVLLPREI